jgi:hypothetical protein
LKRHIARVDANHREIVAALRQAGVLVLSLAAIGKGCPDLLICVNNRLLLVEVKDGAKAPSARKLTPMEQDFAARWPVHVVESVGQALELVAALRSGGQASKCPQRHFLAPTGRSNQKEETNGVDARARGAGAETC